MPDIEAVNAKAIDIARAMRRVHEAHPDCPFVATLHGNLDVGGDLLVTNLPGFVKPDDGGGPKT